MAGLSRAHLVVLVIFCLTLVLCVRLYSDHGLYARACRGEEVPRGSPEDLYFNIAKFIAQRNNMSRMLNIKQQKIGQIECEKLENTKSKSSNVASSGGWCAKTSVEDSGEHKTDDALVPVLADFFSDMYVGSFGDGPGRYKQKLLSTGKLRGYDAYDGAPFSETTSEGRVQFLDLTIPQYGLPMYDWIMSLEVAEHIPKEYESVFIDNIVRHARYGVVLSWAVPGQAGYSHINNRSPDYVRQVFEKQGFKHDKKASEVLKKAATLPWLISNTNVYRRKDTSVVENIRTFFS